MTDYVKSTNFASKDSLASGNPLKIVKGTEIDTEFTNIATSISTKLDSNGGTLTSGTVSGSSISGGTVNNTVIGGSTPAAVTGTTVTATTGFVGSIAVGSGSITTTNWTVVESGGVLYFKYGGVNKMKLDSSGNITVTGNVTAYGTV
jgi:hypothetical protein